MSVARSLTISALAIPALCLAAAPAAGAALAYEGFNYAVTADTNGAFAGFNGGSGFARGWDDAVNGAPDAIESGSLAYPNLVTSGNYARTQNSGRMGRVLDVAGAFSAYNLGDGTIGKSGTTLWYGVVAQTPNTQSYQALEFHHNTDGDTQYEDTRDRRLALELFGTTRTLKGFSNLGAPVTSSAVGTPNTAVTLYVFKFEFADGNDAISLYVNPTPGVTPSTPTATLSYDLSFDRVTFASFVGSTETRFDEIRLGATYADVAPAVPEPVAAGLFGVAAVLGVRRRRLGVV